MTASALDWVVQGGTYGVYQAITAAPPTVVAPVVADCTGTAGLLTLGGALTVSATSDIDADTVGALVVSFTPSLKSDGTVATAAPAGYSTFTTGPTTVDDTICGASSSPAGVGNGQVTNCSADNVF